MKEGGEFHFLTSLLLYKKKKSNESLNEWGVTSAFVVDWRYSAFTGGSGVTIVRMLRSPLPLPCYATEWGFC